MKLLPAILLLSLNASASDVTLAWDLVTNCTYQLTNSLGSVTNSTTTNATMQVPKGVTAAAPAVFRVRADMDGVVSDWSAPAYWPIWHTNYGVPVAARLVSGYWLATIYAIPGTYYGVQESLNGTNWSTHASRVLASPRGQLAISERRRSGESRKWFRTVYPPLQ